MRRASSGFRALGVLIALALALVFSQPRLASAAGVIALNPTSGAVGTTVQVVGSGFAPGTQVALYFANSPLGVTANVDIGGNFTANFQVPNIALGPYSVTAVGTNTLGTATFTVTTATSALTLVKAVSVNGVGGYSFSGNAHQGDQLFYRLSVVNNTGAAINGVTVSDVLQPGQAPFISNSNCTYTLGTNTVTCTALVPLAAGTTQTFFFTTVVNSGFVGVIPNTASVTATGVPAIGSNTTNVFVATPIGVAFPLQICGPITAYAPPALGNNGSITIAGITLAISPLAVFTGPTVAVGQNICLNITTAGSAVIGSSVTTLNLSGLRLICGAFLPTVNPAVISVAGVNVAVAGTLSLVPLGPGGYYCFVLNTLGQAFAVLSGTPTSISVAPRRHFAAYRGPFQAE